MSVASFANIFSHSVGCLFVLFMVSFAVQKLLHLIRSHLFIFFIFIFFRNSCSFIYLFMTMLSLRFCARAFSSCGERGPLFIAVRGLLTIAASLVAEHRLQTRRLSSCGSRAQLLRSMWDLPRPGLEPVSPALAGRFSTTAPPGKPPFVYFCFYFHYSRRWRAKGLEHSGPQPSPV